MWKLTDLIKKCQEIRPFLIRVHFAHNGRDSKFRTLMSDLNLSPRIILAHNSQKKSERRYYLDLNPEELLNKELTEFNTILAEFRFKNEETFEQIPENCLRVYLARRYSISFPDFVGIAFNTEALRWVSADDYTGDGEVLNEDDIPIEKEIDWDHWFRHFHKNFSSQFAGIFEIGLTEFQETIQSHAKSQGSLFSSPRRKTRTYRIQTKIIHEARKHINLLNGNENTTRFFFLNLARNKDALKSTGIADLLIDGNTPRLFTLETLELLPLLPMDIGILSIQMFLGRYLYPEAYSFGPFQSNNGEELAIKNIEETRQKVRAYFAQHLEGSDHYDNLNLPPEPKPFNEVPESLSSRFPWIKTILEKDTLKLTNIIDLFVELRILHDQDPSIIPEYSNLYFYTANIIMAFIQHYQPIQHDNMRPIELADIRFVLEFPKIPTSKLRYDISDLRGWSYYKRNESSWKLNHLETKYYHSMNILEGRSEISTLIERYLEYPGAEKPESLLKLSSLIQEFGIQSSIVAKTQNQMISAAMRRFDLETAGRVVNSLFPGNSIDFHYIQDLLVVQKELASGADGEIPGGSYHAYINYIAKEWEDLCEQLLRFKYGHVASVRSKETRLVSNKIPDFVLNPQNARRAEMGRIEFASILADAKKSVLAITDDAEEYAPYCDQLWFLVLDDEKTFERKHPKVKYFFAREMLKDWSVPPELAQEVMALYTMSMDRVNGFRKFLLNMKSKPKRAA